jgi:hypothetical protein
MEDYKFIVKKCNGIIDKKCNNFMYNSIIVIWKSDKTVICVKFQLICKL